MSIFTVPLSDFLDKWFHIHPILPPFLPNITLGIQLTPTYSSVYAGYFLDFIAPTFINLVISRPLWMLQNPNDPCPLPLTFRRSRPTLFYTIPLIFLSTSQFHRHQTGLEKHTRLLHWLVSTGTYGNSYTQINWDTVQFFHLCWKTNFASCQLILRDGATTTTSLASTT